MSESLLTDAPTAIAAETRDDHVVLPFSSMQSLITTSDGVDDGTQSFVSLDPIIPDDRLAANHGSDPMIASVRRSGSLGDIRILGLQQRSFSMEDTSFNKENHFENSVSKNCASSKSVDQNDSSINYGDPPDPLNSPSGSNGGCEEVLCAKDHPLISDLATERDEDIRRIEETAYCIMDGVELPRASDPGVFCPNEDDCVSPTVLLDDSMTPLVGTPHAMSYIPMEDIFTFVDRRPNQELPAITEENEEQTLRRQRHYRSSLSGRRSRSPSRSAPLEEGGQAASNPDLEAELVKELWYPIDNEIPSAGYVHRRAISDNLGVQPVRPELQRSQEMEEIDRAGNDEDVHMRSARAVARASSVVTNRCQSQVFLTQIGLNDAAASAPVLDRNLSSSDPSVNDEKPSSKTQECPPPVLLTRKASSIHNETWKNQCAPETAAQPTPVQVRKEPVGTGSRPQSMTRTENGTTTTPSPPSNIAPFSRGMNFMRRSLRRLAGDSQRRSESIDIAMFHSLDTVATTGGAEGLQEPSSCSVADDCDVAKSSGVRRVATVPIRQRTTPYVKTRPSDRIEKKKTKSGSDTFSFGSLFGSNKGARSKKKMGNDRSLETVISSFQSRAPHGSAVSFPSRRVVPSMDHPTRLPIPDFEGLPDHLSSALSTPVEANEADAASYDSSTTAKYNLNLPQWARFDLFAKEEYHSWHDKYRHDKISAKVLKKQDAIFELILIEKSHCAHLAFLQQAYRNRLLQEKILVEEDVDRLIPDVLDALLVFHLNLLDRLTARQRESDEVETISDILAEELSDEGKHIGIAISAYTTFGSSKERSEKMFESLMAKNTRFAEFIRTSAQDPLYRQYEFKSTMTRVISRPAKYGLLVETILKNEYNKFTKESELTQKALLAAKRFAMKIDNNLLMAQMAQRWDDVRSHFDHGSHTNLYLVDKDKPNGVVRITFTMEDLDIDMKHVGSGQRRLMCLGDVGMKNAASKVVEKVFMVLFDDILVCLQRRNNQKYVFIQQEQSVFPVNGLILRPADRSASVMIISGAVTKPALLEVEFNSKTDRAKWMKTLETAIHSAPVKVRMSPRNEDEAARQIEIERQLQLKKQKEAEDAWLRKLNEMFEQRSSQERVIQDYMTTLMKFFDDLRTHLQSLPMKSRPDVADRIREAVRQHCRELRSSRTAPLNRLIENVCVARESELWSFIDVSAEMAVDGTPDSDGGGSSSDSSGSGRGQRPRRIHTFHGTTAPPSGQSTSKEHTREKSTIRRHTTVPRMSVGQDGGVDRSDEDDERYEPSEERREQLEVEEKAHRLPLGLNLKARRAMTNLIRDVVKLKTENNHLRNEISLNKTRLAMKERTQHTVVPSVLASDTMEALRRKEQEVREEDARRRRELEQMAEQIRAEQERQRQQEELLKAEKEQLRRSEEELAQKWAALHAATVGGGGSPEGRVVGRISMKSPSAISRMTSFRDQKVASVSQPGISPALRNLTKKSEVKKVKK